MHLCPQVARSCGPTWWRDGLESKSNVAEIQPIVNALHTSAWGREEISGYHRVERLYLHPVHTAELTPQCRLPWEGLVGGV